MPSAKHSARRSKQLPAGRHGLDPEYVIANQRQRILEAVATVCADKGYAGMAVEDVVSEAGVSRRTFYDHYPNREAVFLDAYETASDLVLRAVRDAYAGADSFVEAVQDCIEAFLVALASQPEMTTMAIVEVLAAGPVAVGKRNETMGAFAQLFRDGAKRFDQETHGPALLPQTIIGGMYEVVYTRILAGEAAQLPTLLPDFCFSALLPYLGNDGAQAEYERLVARRDRLQSG